MSSAQPTGWQIVAGMDDSNNAAAASGSQPVISDGRQNISVTGLASSTSYTAHFVERDTDLESESNILSSPSFVTL